MLQYQVRGSRLSAETAAQRQGEKNTSKILQVFRNQAINSKKQVGKFDTFIILD